MSITIGRSSRKAKRMLFIWGPGFYYLGSIRAIELMIKHIWDASTQELLAEMYLMMKPILTFLSLLFP